MALISAASLQAAFSSLFRLASYVYLRIVSNETKRRVLADLLKFWIRTLVQIPFPQARFAIPSLFITYVSLWIVDVVYSSRPALTATGVRVGEEGHVDVKPPTNGDSSNVNVHTTGIVNVMVSDLFSNCARPPEGLPRPSAGYPSHDHKHDSLQPTYVKHTN